MKVSRREIYKSNLLVSVLRDSLIVEVDVTGDEETGRQEVRGLRFPFSPVNCFRCDGIGSLDDGPCRTTPPRYKDSKA